MTTTPPSNQLLWLTQVMASRMLLDAASDARDAQLDQALRHWLLDVDGLTLIQVRKEVQGYLRGLAGAVDQRLATYVASKRAEPLPGCDGRL